MCECDKSASRVESSGFNDNECEDIMTTPRLEAYFHTWNMSWLSWLLPSLYIKCLTTINKHAQIYPVALPCLVFEWSGFVSSSRSQIPPTIAVINTIAEQLSAKYLLLFMRGHHPIDSTSARNVPKRWKHQIQTVAWILTNGNRIAVGVNAEIPWTWYRSFYL